MNNTTNFTNSTNSPVGDNNNCFTVKCMFTVGERVAIILSFFLIFLVSLAGNCVLFFVIIKNKRLRMSSTNFSILNLSLANILMTAFYIPAFTIDIFIVDGWVFGLMGCKLIIFLQHLSINAAIATLVVISVEKFLVVSYPFYVRAQRRKVRYLILCAWVVALVESSVYLSYRTLKNYNGVMFCIEVWPSFKTRQVFNVIQAVVFCFVPLAFMITLHAVTIKRIKAQLKFRGSSSCPEVNMMEASYQSVRLKKRKKAVAMLVVIVASFAVLLLPYYSFTCWRLLGKPETVTDLYAVNVGFIVSYLLMCLNSACHPVIYGLMSSVYRQALKTSLSFRRQTGSRTSLSSSARRHKLEQNALILTAQAVNNTSG